MEIINFAPHVFWFMAAIVLIGYELIAGFNLLFLFFMGLSAVCLGFMTYYNFIDPNNLTAQLIIFLTLFTAFFIVFWKPIRKILNGKNHKQFQNIVGQHAEVISKDLTKKKIGKIRWSGTEVRAKLHEDSSLDNISKGDAVEIIEIKDNTFIVKSVN